MLFNKTTNNKPFIIGLLCCFIFFSTALPVSYANNSEIKAFESNLLKLQGEFEIEVSKSKNSDQTNSLAMKTSAIIWALTAHYKTGDIIWLKKIEVLQNEYKSKKSLSSKNLISLELYYQTVLNLTLLKINAENNNISESKTFLLKIKTASQNEIKTIDSNLKLNEENKNINKSLILMETINILLTYINLIEAQQYSELNFKKILKILNLKKENIKTEKKIHKEGKNLILQAQHLNHINKNLFKQIKFYNLTLNFLELEHFLEKQLKDNKELPNFLAASWVTHCQISFALAFIYAHNL